MRLPCVSFTALAAVWSLVSAGSQNAQGIKAALQRVADKMQKKYDMSLAAAFYAPGTEVEVAAGFTDRGLGMGAGKRKALPDDRYVWGSTTKMYTGPAVLQLAEKGLISLEDPITKHADDVLRHLGAGRTLEDHFGPKIHEVRIKHLLHMTSAIRDYDGDNYTLDQFASRSKGFGPVEIIFNYTPPNISGEPGQMQGYCSTNYILLGLVLLKFSDHEHPDPWHWQDYKQIAVIPEALRSVFTESDFILSGTCEDHTPVHGFMEYYPGVKIPPQDVWNISCVGGWTAGNFVGSVRDVARFTYDLYSWTSERIVSNSSQQLMIDFSSGPGRFQFYGMGTFQLDWTIGPTFGQGPPAYGHVGDTYGYQSQTTYFPEKDFVLSVATNVETQSQAQPADFTCSAYHEVLSEITGSPKLNCTFTVHGRFIGACSCVSEEELSEKEALIV